MNYGFKITTLVGDEWSASRSGKTFRLAKPKQRPPKPFESYQESDKRKKGKAVQLQAWSGPESFRKLRFPDFMTTA